MLISEACQTRATPPPPADYRKVEKQQSYVGCPGKPSSVNEMQVTLQKLQGKKGAAAWWAYIRVVIAAGVDHRRKGKGETRQGQVGLCYRNTFTPTSV
jgi:hypothetical protein